MLNWLGRGLIECLYSLLMICIRAFLSAYMLVYMGSDGVMRGVGHILRCIIHSYQGNNTAHDYMSILDIYLYAPPGSFEYIS